MRKHALLGGPGGKPPQENFEFRTSEIASAGFSGQVSVAKIIHISSIQEALSLLFTLFLLSIVCGANLKLRQANARAYRVHSKWGLGFMTDNHFFSVSY